VTRGASFEALGVRVHVLATDERRLGVALDVVQRELVAVDLACSRFRDGSELVRLNATTGRRVEVGALLCDALEAAFWAASATGGAVDPTVGRSLRALGWDADFALVGGRDGHAPVVLSAAAGWRSVDFDRERRLIRVPHGVELDLGATAKAFAADRCARLAYDAARCGVLVNLGGDVAVCGAPPGGGWRVVVADDHRAPLDTPGQVIALSTGGLATSSTTVRRWHAGGVERHHIVDPRTGAPTRERWRTVSVAGADCLQANAASTAAHVLGDAAVPWLEVRRLPTRLLATDGSVTSLNGWPA
jgi:thiamine biosynthesis lipoprotein